MQMRQGLAAVMLLAVGGIPLSAEVVFAPDVQIIASAMRNDSVVFVAGEKGGRGFLARVDDPNGAPAEIAIDVPESSRLMAVAIDREGSIYVAGLGSEPEQSTVALVQKYDIHGVRQYSVVIGGRAQAAPRSIVVNNRGEALINGSVVGGGFPITPGAPVETAYRTGFVVKLSAQGQTTVSVRGVGDGAAAYDLDDNIYIAGVSASLPVTAGAFQSTYELNPCAGGLFMAIACEYAQVIKLSPDGTRILYSTFLTGSYGARPAALAVNDNAMAIVAGTTHSPDYPTTEGALFPQYRATERRRPGWSWPLRVPVIPPPSSGYITMLNADGTGLVWSTFFSGTGADSITDMIALPDGRIAITGQAGSADLPGLSDFPVGCTPWAGRPQPYISVLSGDGAGLLTTLVPWHSGRIAAAGNQQTFGIASTHRYTQYSSAADQRDVCVADPSSWTLIEKTSPGKLLTIFGRGLENAPVDFDGVPARILYSSPGQINVLTPFELAPNRDATLRIGAAHRTIEQRLRIAGETPGVYLARLPFDMKSVGAACGMDGVHGVYEPEAVNADGTLNTCESRAPAGTTVDLMLNGLGAERPTLSLADVDLDTARIESVEYDHFLLKWQLRIRVWPHDRDRESHVAVTPIADGVKSQFAPVVIWTKP